MARIEVNRALADDIARLLARHVVAVAEEVAEEARDRAPGAKTWVSSQDERVRPSHVEADGQVVPENVRFVVGQALLHEPRDPAAPAEETDQCRCTSVLDPGAIARAITCQGPHLTGSQVRAQVSVEFPRVAEAEHGDGDHPGAHFLGGAVDSVARRN